MADCKTEIQDAEDAEDVEDAEDAEDVRAPTHRACWRTFTQRTCVGPQHAERVGGLQSRDPGC